MRTAMSGALIIATAMSVATADSGHNPSHETVPDASVAVAIGRAVLIPNYSEKVVQSEEPFVAKREGAVWTVSGTLHCGLPWWEKMLGDRCMGGTAEVKLSAKTGKVLHVTHYK
jgi:hypothetical protein